MALRSLGVSAALLLLLTAPATAQVMEYDNGEVYAWFSVAENDGQAAIIDTWSLDYSSGVEVWDRFRVFADNPDYIEIWADGMWAPYVSSAYGPRERVWDGANCGNWDAIRAVMQRRQRENMRDALVAGLSAWILGMGGGVPLGATTRAIETAWDLAEYTYACHLG